MVSKVLFHEWLQEALAVFWDCDAENVIFQVLPPAEYEKFTGQKNLQEAGGAAYGGLAEVHLAINSRGEQRLVYPIAFQRVLHEAILAYERARLEWEAKNS